MRVWVVAGYEYHGRDEYSDIESHFVLAVFSKEEDAEAFHEVSPFADGIYELVVDEDVASIPQLKKAMDQEMARQEAELQQRRLDNTVMSLRSLTPEQRREVLKHLGN